MKLRNLFLASLIVCTMASCSKDDDGISGPQEVDAYLSFASTTDVMTKASIDGGTDKEAKIQSLTAYVFDESGKYVISKHCRAKIYEVAEQVGYKDITYFSATFKRVAGVSPSEYQDTCR